ncbi:MAG: hypothetical protein AAGB04_19235 [Pseudomonadota bacterium]
MDPISILFWLLIALIAVLAYTVETGLARRHRRIMLSSLASATIVAVYIALVAD